MKYFFPILFPLILLSYSWAQPLAQITEETESDYYPMEDSYAGMTEATSYEALSREGDEATTEFGEQGEEEFEVEGPTQTEDGFMTLDPSVAQTDIKIAGILNIGIQEVIKQAIANGSLYNSPYDLAEVHSVQQNIDNPNEYSFEVSVRDNIFNILRMNFDLTYDESSNTIKILSWGYPDNGEEGGDFTVDEIPAGYQEIKFDLNDPDSLVYHIEEAGLQVVITIGVLEGTINSYYFVPTNIRSVSEKLEGDKLYYRFDLDAADQYGNSARFTYVVSIDPATSIPKLEEMLITNVVRAS